ncbi:DUF3152 domain-containing protein [Streptomyces sp. NPDC047022]|uniref:DUF3152 domain-containing protein n=1 Tax=Streptomyces sp. NPDC047022 TaxID=3155737 RepID=UPI0033D0B1B4
MWIPSLLACLLLLAAIVYAGATLSGSLVEAAKTAKAAKAAKTEQTEQAEKPAKSARPRASAETATIPTPPPTRDSRPAASPGTPSASPAHIAVPRSGPGTFTTARSSGAVVGGSGPLHRYEVQVEDGVDIRPEKAAAEIQTMLADPRSWAAHGKGRFQLVAAHADVIIKIATPATTDRLCASAGGTHGELNCEVSGGVIVNLKRWVTGSPEYNGPPAEYRNLIINHEIGHLLGYGHMDCPGPGRAAPAMMQQIKGLHGCKSNAWPYTKDGTFIDGPPVP